MHVLKGMFSVLMGRVNEDGCFQVVEKLARRKQRSFSVLCVCLWAQRIALPRFRGFQLAAIWTHICPLVDIFALRRKDSLAQIFATCPFPTNSKSDTPAVFPLFVSLSSSCLLLCCQDWSSLENQIRDRCGEIKIICCIEWWVSCRENVIEMTRKIFGKEIPSGHWQINESRKVYYMYFFLAQRTLLTSLSTAPAMAPQIYSVPSNKTDSVPRTLRYSHNVTAAYGRILLLADVTACELYSASILSLFWALQLSQDIPAEAGSQYDKGTVFRQRINGSVPGRNSQNVQWVTSTWDLPVTLTTFKNKVPN